MAFYGMQKQLKLTIDAIVVCYVSWIQIVSATPTERKTVSCDYHYFLLPPRSEKL